MKKSGTPAAKQVSWWNAKHFAIFQLQNRLKTDASCEKAGTNYTRNSSQKKRCGACLHTAFAASRPGAFRYHTAFWPLVLSTTDQLAARRSACPGADPAKKDEAVPNDPTP